MDLDSKFNELKSVIKSIIENAKRSILYDINNKIQRLEGLFKSKSMSFTNNDEAWQKINSELPFDNLENFEIFDTKLGENDELNAVLVIIYFLIKLNIYSFLYCKHII